MEGKWTALDSPGAQAFLHNAKTSDGHHLFDRFGFMEGECEAYSQTLNDTDADADGVADVCDNCPTVFNPEQLTDNDDPDNDGIGQACDFCDSDGLKTQIAFDRNYEAELGETYPGFTAPRIIDHDTYPDINEQIYSGVYKERARFKAAFRGDACDPVPVATQEIKPGGSLPAAEMPNVPYACSLSQKQTAYQSRNSISVTAYGSPTITAATGGAPISATVGLRWCNCDNQLTSTLNGRVHCQLSGCKVDGNLYHMDLSKSWIPIVTQADAGWSGATGTFKPGKDIGREKTLPIGGPTLNTWSVDWDFLELPIGNVVSTPSYASTNGVLWAQIPSPLGQQIPQVLDKEIDTYSATYGPGNAYAGVGCQDIVPPAAIIVDPLFCKECPMGIAEVFTQAGDPALYRVTASGAQPQATIPAATQAVYRDIDAKKVRYVRASEPLGRLATRAIPGQSCLRGVTIDPTGAVVLRMEAAALDELAAPVNQAPAIGAPKLVGGEGFALSAETRRLYVAGGITANVPSTSLSVLDLDASTWSKVPLKGKTFPGTVVATAFRSLDDLVYVVDRSGSSLRLFSIQPRTGVATQLAALPATWSASAPVSLVVGGSGDLLIAGTLTAGGATPYVLARYTVATNGSVALAGTAYTTQAALTTPQFEINGVTQAISGASGPVLQTIPLNAFR